MSGLYLRELLLTATQVRDYLQAAIAHFAIDIRLSHRVEAMKELGTGWTLELSGPDGPLSEQCDFVVIATGHHTKDRAQLTLKNREAFEGGDTER